MQPEQPIICFVSLQKLSARLVRKTSLSTPVIHYLPLHGGSFVLVLCCLFLVSEFR